MFGESNTKVHEDNAKLLVKELKAVPLILDVMKKFSGDKDIVFKACQVIESLCHVKELRKSIFEAKALSSLANAMDKHNDNGGIRETVNTAMEHFLEYSKSI